MRIINVVIYLILMKNVMGDLPSLKIFLNDILCVSQYILSQFHYNNCRKGKEIEKNIRCLATCC